MRICPKCRKVYPNKGIATCPQDGTRLADAREFNESLNDPLIGANVAGRYRILERIGTGGMGTVYRAEQEGLARHVALKVLKKDLSWESDTVTRFEREAKAMSLLSHPNTVRVYDFGQTDDDQLFFAMELVEGELLTARIEREGALDVREAIRFARQILGSLSEAHGKGIVHRDLKPDNIFIARVDGEANDVIKVLDFGIAKMIAGERQIDQLETQAGTVFGTPRYMSPEQAQGKPLDPRSDLYTVGVLLYHMLSGRAPFLDDDAVVVMAKHIREKASPLHEIAPERPIPLSLSRAVAKAMEKDREKRFKNAEAFSNALKASFRDVSEAVEAIASGRHPAPGFIREIPRIPLAVGAALVLGATVFAGYLIATSGGDIDPSVAVAAPPQTSESASEPAAGTESEAQVSIATRPRGAEVWSDGSLLGTTPLTVQRPVGETMEVELRLVGYLPRRAEITAGEALEAFELRPERAAEAVTIQTPAESRPRTRMNLRARQTAMAGPMDDGYERWD